MSGGSSGFKQPYTLAQSENVLVFDLYLRYFEAYSDWYAAERVRKLSGHELYRREDAKMHCRIVFDLLDVNNRYAVFNNGTRLKLLGEPKSLGGGSVDWNQFCVYSIARPSLSDSRIDEFTSQDLGLTLIATGPYESYGGDDLTDKQYASFSFVYYPPEFADNKDKTGCNMQSLNTLLQRIDSMINTDQPFVGWFTTC